MSSPGRSISQGFALAAAVFTAWPAAAAVAKADAGPFEVASRASRLAVLRSAAGSLDVYLLEGGAIERLRLDDAGLVRVDAFRLPLDRARGLFLDAQEGVEGRPGLLAAVVADDVRSVYEGTDSNIHAWILTAGEGGLAPVSGDLHGYVRFHGGVAWLQERAPGKLFLAGARRMTRDAGGYSPAGHPAGWFARWILDATPLPGADAALAFDGGRPVVVDSGGARLPGGSVLGTFQQRREPAVAVRLDQPQYRLGFDKEGRVADIWHPVPPRVLLGPDGDAYTVRHGRTPGLPLVGGPSGNDAVVRVSWRGGRAEMARPYRQVDGYVLDFALVPGSGDPPAVLVLMNDEVDGSGAAYVQLQSPR